MIARRLRPALFLFAAALMLVALAAGRSPQAHAAADPVIAAAGDIACDAKASPAADEKGAQICHMAATAALINAMHPAAVLTLGDEQYPDGTLAQFENGYDRTWGAFKGITHPAPGNHEYHTPNAAGYFSYFGSAAGDPTTGYYSFELGSWHLISLNGNCAQAGGCGPASPEIAWLKHDLTTHHAACTLAFWHQPRFSSGEHHSDSTYDAMWRVLYAARADIVLNGHDHDYERFAPQTPDATADASTGITEFIVGTGGRSHYKIGRIEPNSRRTSETAFGVLKLTLHARSFDWRFISEPGAAFTDAGSGTCHGPTQSR